MSSFINLVKAFSSSGDMSEPLDRGQKIKIAVLSIFSVCFIFLPVLIIVGVVVKLMTETLIPVGMGTFGIEFMFHIICFFTFVFGINIIFSEYYFANDIEFLLPLPLRASKIVGAKFIATCLRENIMQFLFVVSCIVGYGLGSDMGPMGYILSIIGVITLPVLVLAYCGIISILIMGFTRFIRRKEIIQRMSMTIIFIMLLILVASIGKLQNLDMGVAIEAMAKGDYLLFNILDVIFPNVPLFVETFSEGNILALLGYILVNIVAIAIMLGLAELLYFKSVVGLNSSAVKNKTAKIDKLLEKSKIRSQSYSYFMKEVKILVRTPAFFTNCVMINFIWPVFVYAICKVSGMTLDILGLQERYGNDDISLQLIILLGVVGISVLLSSLNSISSNSISREGKHFSFMKYIPVPYSVQWNVKVMVGVMFSAMGVLVFFIPACIIIKMPVIHIILFTVLSIMAVSFVSYMGIYIDSIQPKLIWDDELNSLRGNYNCFFSMAIAIAFVSVICIGGFFVFKRMNLSIEIVSGILFMILLIANAVVIALSHKSGERNIIMQEET